MKKIDYKELIEEINDEVSEGVLTLNDSIQILRSDTPLFEDYYEIIDWYYDDYIMQEELETPLTDIYLIEEFTEEEWKEMEKDQIELKKQYEEDKDKLIIIKVKDALTEMKRIQKLF